MNLNQDQWLELLYPPGQKLEVLDASVAIFCDVDAGDQATEAGLVFHVRHVETGHEWNQLNMVPLTLLPNIAAMINAACEQLGYPTSRPASDEGEP